MWASTARDFAHPTSLAAASAAAALRFLRNPSRPIIPRPVANRGKAAGIGVSVITETEVTAFTNQLKCGTSECGESCFKHAQHRTVKPGNGSQVERVRRQAAGTTCILPAHRPLQSYRQTLRCKFKTARGERQSSRIKANRANCIMAGRHGPIEAAIRVWNIA
jgi:hypothetical protein